MTSVIIINHGRIIINSPMSKFTQEKNPKSKLKTTDIKQTTNLLQQAKIPFDRQDDAVIVDHKDIDKIQKLLFDNEIWIEYLAPTGLTLEQKIVNILRQEQGEIIMKINLSHEFYKFAHRKIPLYGILVLLVLMLYTVGTSYKMTPSLLSQGFGAGQWAIIIIIAISSDMIAMEWRNNTMATLLYKTSHKSILYTAKFIVLVFIVSSYWYLG